MLANSQKVYITTFKFFFIYFSKEQSMTILLKSILVGTFEVACKKISLRLIILVLHIFRNYHQAFVSFLNKEFFKLLWKINQPEFLCLFFHRCSKHIFIEVKINKSNFKTGSEKTFSHYVFSDQGPSSEISVKY